MSIDTTFLRRCIASLERALEGIERQEPSDDVMYDIYRAACVNPPYSRMAGRRGDVRRQVL